ADRRPRPAAGRGRELSEPEVQRAVQPPDGRARRHGEPHLGRAHALQRARAGVQHGAPAVSRQRDREDVRLQGIPVLRGTARSQAGAEGRLQEVMSSLLPWERLLWSSRPWRLSPRVAGERYLLTDFRLLRVTRRGVEEIALDDVGDIQRTESTADRVLGTSTIVVQPRRRGTSPIVLAAVRRGGQLAALLELLAGDPRAPRDPDAVRSALAWEPRKPAFAPREALAGFVAMLSVMFAVAIGLHGKTAAVTYRPDDAIAPGGEKRSHAEIVGFMETEVMPWARAVLGRLKGGPDRVTCETCHGANGGTRGWQMPAVAALPQPELRDRGWETYTTGMDAQMRNAIYGYVAESDNQAKAAYMREIVMPGMARLLRRPAYDFTQPYEYNRTQHALG